MCECAVCRDGIDAIEERERQNMETVGWYAHYVPDADDCPYGINYHTHGSDHSFNHLDMQVCLAADPQTLHHVLSIAVGKIKEGAKFEHGKTYDDLIEPANGEGTYKVLMLEAEECGRKVLRLIMPDKHGKLDGELFTQMLDCKDADVHHET